MSTQDPVISSLSDGSIYITEREFHADPVAWCRRADNVPRVIVTSDDREHIRLVIIQQREPLDLKAN
jgi:hypothetical protein